MATAAGLNKQVKIKREVTYGTVPAAASSQLLRRVSSSFNLAKDTYRSNEIRADRQIADFRHGVRRVQGSISGELSPGTYADIFSQMLQKEWVAGTSISGLSITIAGSGPTYTVTRGSGDFLTGGIKIGDVVRLTVGSLNAANINKNLLITALTATIATVIPLNGVALVAEGPIATTTFAVQGKKAYIPSSSHTGISFSLEHWFSDVPASEVFSGVKFNSGRISLPPTGLATVELSATGKDITTSASEFFTAPTAVTTTTALAAVNGVLTISGTQQSIVTGCEITLAPAQSGDPVVGSNVVPTQFPGMIQVSGQITAQFDATTLRDIFVNETEATLTVVLTTDNTATAGLVGFTMSRIKIGGADKSDGEGGIVQTLPFTALLNTAGGTSLANDATTLSMQDTSAP